MSIKNIIFDLGGVLVDFHPKQGMKDMGMTEEAISQFEKHIFSGLWEECDKIPYEMDEIKTLFKSHVVGYEKEVELLWDNLWKVTSVYPYTEKWLRQLKDRGYHLYVLSNYGKCSFEINSKIYDFLKYFDGKVVSYEVKEVKPDARIYEILLEKYHLNREECVFIDDRFVNVEGAKKCGIKGLQFTTYEKTSKELNKLLDIKG